MNLGDEITNKIKIVNDGLHTQIFIDDIEIPRIREYHLAQSVDSLPQLSLEMIPEIEKIELEGQFEYVYYDYCGNELVVKKYE